jgi:hypothetical protein
MPKDMLPYLIAMFQLIHSLWAICIWSDYDTGRQGSRLHTAVLCVGETGERLADMADGFAEIRVRGRKYTVSDEQLRQCSRAFSQEGSFSAGAGCL